MAPLRASAGMLRGQPRSSMSAYRLKVRNADRFISVERITYLEVIEDTIALQIFFGTDKPLTIAFDSEEECKRVFDELGTLMKAGGG
jgi:hypothetical protein